MWSKQPKELRLISGKRVNMKQVRDFVSRFLLEMLIGGVGSLFAILWLFNGKIIALEEGRSSNKENIILLREDIKELGKDNKKDHTDILRALNARP